MLVAVFIQAENVFYDRFFVLMKVDRVNASQRGLFFAQGQYEGFHLSLEEEGCMVDVYLGGNEVMGKHLTGVVHQFFVGGERIDGGRGNDLLENGFQGQAGQRVPFDDRYLE